MSSNADLLNPLGVTIISLASLTILSYLDTIGMPDKNFPCFLTLLSIKHITLQPSSFKSSYTIGAALPAPHRAMGALLIELKFLSSFL